MAELLAAAAPPPPGDGVIADPEALRPLLSERPPRAVRTPTVMQMEAIDCGPATLAIVLGHFGRWVPLEALRQATGVSRNGSNAGKLLETARSYGLEMQGLKAEPEALRHVQPPLILHWDFSHFVVFEGFVRRRRVRINDPRTGPREISLDELDKGMTGVALAARPGADFRTEGKPPDLFTALRDRLRGSALSLLFLFATSLLLLFPGLALPSLVRLFVDQALVAGADAWISPIMVGLGLAAVALGLLTALQREHLLRLETRLAAVDSGRFLWHLLRLPLEFFHQRYTGDISSRIALNDQIAQLLSRQLATNALGVVVIAVFGVCMFRIDPVLTAASFGVISLNVLVLRKVSRRRVDANRMLLREQAGLNGIALWGLEMIESLKSTGSESDFFSRWAGQQAKVVNLRQSLERVNLPLHTLPVLLTALNTALILGVGGLRVLQDQLSLGSLVAFQILTAAFVAPANRLVNLGGRLQLAEGEVALCADVLQTVPRTDLEPRMESGDGPERLGGRLALRQVTFGYAPNEPPTVRGLDVTLGPGRWVALVGPTGSGKST
ncbi:MAG: cysteine peptidase family C39 domain-containing protein, partial [Acidobacteriota bacterium]